MNVKTAFIAIFVFLISFMILFFSTNPSYEKSLEARYHYELGHYDKAYALAKEAFSEDIYNRMAATIMAQSQTALKYQEYIDQAEGYLKQINELLHHDQLSDADRSKIKIMSKIVVESYTKLAPSVITDKDLVAKAAKYYDEFGKILDKVDR
jgi:tetratricopeptide (TPR) repeat protein